MKKHILEFIRRGCLVCWIGPVVLAIIYLILGLNGLVQTLSVYQVCVGILSLTVLAFLAGGLNTLYQMERLPLMGAILIHGGVLYAGYLATYLLNDWLEWGKLPFLVFTGIFVVGYLVIWVVIYWIIKRKTAQINKMLEEKQKNTKE